MPARTTPLLVLLEGPSDVAALDAVLGSRAPRVPGTAYRLVDMGGVTNTAAHLRAAARTRPRPPVLGLCDAAEAWVVARALTRAGVPVGDVGQLPAHGFFVCRRDLEDELIRALGTDRCLDLLEGMGLGHRFRAFSSQPVWVGRPVHDRLHRFAGIASGRKVLLAGAMAQALPPDGLPPPIDALVTRLERIVGERARIRPASGRMAP